MPSLSFRERMSGSYWLLDAPTDERAITLSFQAQATDVGEFLRTRTWALAGTIDAEGLARSREIEGTLRFALIEERRLPYRFAFLGDDGCRYELSGQKEWTGLAPVSSMTLLPAKKSRKLLRLRAKRRRLRIRLTRQRPRRRQARSSRLRSDKTESRDGSHVGPDAVMPARRSGLTTPSPRSLTTRLRR